MVRLLKAEDLFFQRLPQRIAVIVWRAPKSESHHLSELLRLLVHIPDDWKEICETVIEKQLP